MTEDPWADHTNPEHLQAAVANLVQESLQNPSRFFQCSADPQAWTPANFRMALASAAEGRTSSLQSGWLTPSEINLPDPMPSVNLLGGYWDELLIELARAGHASLLQAFHRANPSKLLWSAKRPSFLAAALKGGPHNPVLRWLDSAITARQFSADFAVVVTTAAAQEGCLDSLQWLRRPAGMCDWDPVKCAALISETPAWQRHKAGSVRHIKPIHGLAALCTLAAAMDDAIVLRKLRSQIPPCPCNEGTVIVLAQHGGTAALADLLQSSTAADANSPQLWVMAFTAGKVAAAHNQLETLSWIWEHHAPSADQLLSAIPSCHETETAAAVWLRLPAAPEAPTGNVLTCYRPDLAQWAIGISEAALNTGSVRILEWLWDRCPQAFWQQQACDMTTNHTSLKWLLARYPPCHCEPATYSIEHVLGLHTHLPSPGLLDQMVSSRSPGLCDLAAEPGNLGVLRYLRSIQCPWDLERCLLLALVHGHVPIVQWICSQEPSCVWTTHLSNTAAYHDNVEVLLWLLQHQPSWPLPTHLGRTSARCLALLVQWNCPLTPAVQATATAMGPLSSSLVIGLARWQRRCKGMGLKARQTEAARFYDRPLAGICRPLSS